MARLIQILQELKPKKFLSAMKVITLLKNWPSYFKEFFKFSPNKETIYSFRNGLKVHLKEHPLNTRIFNEIWVYECYNPQGFEINSTDIVFDVGANYGNFTLYAANKAKLGKVFAFEPLTENFEILQKNTSLNGLKNVTIFMDALSNKTGKKNFFLAKKDKVSHSFFKSNVSDKNEDVERVTVRTKRLEEVMKKEKIDRIDFLKMDCEGAEYEIFSSISKSTLKKIEKISLETHYLDSKRNVIALKNYLERNGFQVNIVPNFETKFINLLFAKRKK